MKKLTWLTCALLLAACGDASQPDPVDDENSCFTCDAKADGLGISENSYEALAVLEVANTMSRKVLDDDVALDSRAARNIVDTRASDGAFTSLAELDAVAYVGPYAASRMLVFAESNGLIGSCGDNSLQARLESCDDGNTRSGDGCSSACEAEAGATVHGIAEGSEEARMVLAVANTASYRTLDHIVKLDQRAVGGIMADRPFDTLAELDEAYYVGESAFEAMLQYAIDGGVCAEGNVDKLMQAVNDANYNGYFTRSIRTDVTLEEVLDTRSWPGWATHGGCYGVDRDDVPAWVSVGPAESNTRLLALFKAFGESAERVGTEVELDAGIDELACTTSEKTFIGCRFEFQPNPWSGITWNVVSSTDGTVNYFFEGTWTE